MALVNQTLKLEITPGGVPPKLHVTEYDENMQIVAQLYQRGQYYEIPSGTTAKVEGTLAGHPFSADATVDGSNVTFELTKGMTAYAGRAWTKIKLTKDSKPVSSCGFWLECDRAGIPVNVIPESAGFEEQLYGYVAEYLRTHGGGVLPPNGKAGQVLISDGSGGGLWVSLSDAGGSATGVSIPFDDRNDDVKAYLKASASYTAANRNASSVIGSYASTSVQDQDCPKPFQDTYNLMPDTDNAVGEWLVRRLDYAPRMLKLSGVWNVRDCGGWQADGGKIRFGLLFRGARLDGASVQDLSILANVGIKFELDIRDAANAAGATATIPGSTYRNTPLVNAYAPMIQNEADAAATACIAAMEAIVAGNPVYIHCASGADRTGCICAMLEALLGMTDADLDREFELTCFADVENLTGHLRSGGSWTGFWAALPTTQGSAKMNVAKFLRDHGAATTLINSFRQAMIDGSPSSIDIPTYSITYQLTNCTTSSSAISAIAGDPYVSTITPATGYTLTLIRVTIGGTDITSTAVSGNKITISDVDGDVVITALADPITRYSNLVRQAQEISGSGVYNGGLGYKNGYYTSVGGESASANDCCTGLIPYTIDASTQPTDVLYIKGVAGAASASHTRMSMWTPSKACKIEQNGFLAASNYFTVEELAEGYYKLTPVSGLHHSINNVGYVRFSFADTDGANIVITKNEPIE